MKRPLLLAAALLASANLAACGLTGDLKRPDPLWGERTDELPDQNQNNLPSLPDREDEGSDTGADDELLGGA